MSKLTSYPKGHWNHLVVPYNPPFDKLGNIVIFMWHLTGKFQWVPEPRLLLDFWETNEGLSETRKKHWDDLGYFSADVGDEKYTSLGKKSSCEVMCEKLDIDLKQHPLIAQLVFRANENNGTDDYKREEKHKTGGYLKALGYDAMPFLVREIYKVGMFITKKDGIRHGCYVIMTDILHQQAEKDGTLVRKAEGLEQNTMIMNQLKRFVRHTQPYTIWNYAVQMWELGMDEREIAERVYFWRIVREKAEKLRKRARVVIETLHCTVFEVGGHLCIYVKTNDDSIPRAYFERKNGGVPAIILTEIASGCKQILTRNDLKRNEPFCNSLAKLVDILQKNEPGKAKWLYHQAQGNAFNGSRQYHKSVPTVREPSEIMALMNEHLVMPKLVQATDDEGLRLRRAQELAREFTAAFMKEVGLSQAS